MALGKERLIKKIAHIAMGRVKMAKGMIASIAGVLEKLRIADVVNHPCSRTWGGESS